MRNLLILWTLLFNSTIWAAQLDDVSLIELSSSQRSMAIDRGLLENYQEGIFAKFFVQKGDLNNPKIFLVAEGHLVKSFPRKSYWMFSKIHLKEGLIPGDKLLVMNLNSASAGRSLTIKNRHVVFPRKVYQDTEDYLLNNEKNVPARFYKEDKNFEKSVDIFEDELVREADVVVTTYEDYRNKSGSQYSDEYGDLTPEQYFVGNKEVFLADLKNAEDKKLLDSMANGYVQKVNGMKYGLTDFYKAQEKLPEMRDLSKAITLDSVYNQERQEKKIEEQISPRATAKYKRDKESWSEDMDDQTLRRYFIQTGLEREVRRRELALNELDGNEILFHYSGAMINHSGNADQNFRGLGYNLGFAYDLHLSRTSSNLKNWSLQFLLERGVVDYNLGSLNGRSEEGSYGGYLNYYFINNPLTLNSFIYLFGVGIKTGSSTMTSPDLSKEYSYQVLTLPSFQLMTKYRFRTGDLLEDTVNIGASANFGLIFDVKHLSMIDATSDNIDSKFSVNDLKYTIGMSVYF